MPKKQRFSQSAHYKNTAPSGSYSNPSASSSRQDVSVNDLLARHRHASTPPPTAAKRAAVERIVSSPTLPPNIRQILDIPESDAPRPRPPQRRGQHGTNARPMAPTPLRHAAANAIQRAARPPPGPAAPQSWLTGDLDDLDRSRHAPEDVKLRANQRIDDALRRRRTHPGVRWTFSSTRLKGESSSKSNRADDAVYMPTPGSLSDMTLKSMAANWEFIVEYEQLNLATLSGTLKSQLLAYIGIFGPYDGIDLVGLKTLFLTNEELEGATGGDEVEFLNLSGLLGGRLSCLDLKRYFESSGNAKRKVESAQTSKARFPEDEIPLSWDAEPESGGVALPASLNLRFPCLTRLSLANPSAKSASWSDLLSFSKHFATLTHLSLAYWPVPTRTPHATTAVVVADRAPGEVSLGGTHMYSAMDEDWHEAASILRQLSKNTYCLRWLDLEGCHQWLKVLIYGNNNPTSLHGPDARSTRPWLTLSQDHNWEGASSEFEAYFTEPPGPDFNSYWRQIRYINMSQGWIPSDAGAIQSLPAGMISIELLDYLRKRWKSGRPSIPIQPDASLQQVRQWILQEQLAREIARKIRQVRSGQGGLYCEVDCGWGLDEFEGAESGEEG
ncbi:hypothetical protein P152DRAFT_454901 [Eremomyces bilateralis CBS 781.70]|uniref:Tafazzin n=1 Tax=Eremomyces bilateralis CBS 781.70 TaxID=1392243 RepID=A0A6G1GFH8_9PEZI|nr:uncharacterized protein P152DRAFT_454901 [Eremomyces bilateralis CBS 781.70]KAF1816671.1 hypothetical protein P152DRAFT_454901 [Eremomyces bilateralis CBS 781.70]